VKLGYRVAAVSGSVLMTIGFAGMTLIDASSPGRVLLVSCLILGAGMGTQMLSLLLAVQHGVERSRLGVATSLNQFSRSIGAAVGVAAMGAVLARGLSGTSLPGGAGDGAAAAAGAIALSVAARAELADALHRVFVMGAFVSGAGLIATLFLPALDLSHDRRAPQVTPTEPHAPVPVPE
jgi:dipeptide/tripeptide permease